MSHSETENRPLFGEGVLGELALEGAALDAEAAGGLGDVAGAVGEDALDVLPLDPGEGGDVVVAGDGSAVDVAAGDAVAGEGDEEVVDVDGLGQVVGGAAAYGLEGGG